MPTLTLSGAVLRLRGPEPDNLQRPELPPEATRALGPLLQSEGFDLTSPISVLELPLGQGSTSRRSP
jgi:hypothetical protein